MANVPIAIEQARRMAALPVSPAEWSICGFIGVYALAALAMLAATGAWEAFAFRSYLVVWPFVFLVFFPAIYGLLMLLRIVHRLPTRQARAYALRRAFSPRHMRPFATGLLLLAAMMIFQGAFTSVKTALPLWNQGFPHDALQAGIDRALHFGVDPWRYLMPLGGNGMVRAIVEWNYNQGWFVFCYATLFFIAVSKETAGIRTRYFMTYMLVWIVVGNVLAGLFLSAGPAFYGAVTGDTARFAEQLAFLAGSGESAHSASRVQNYLWTLHERGQGGFGSGISAFPSMHIALVTLNALFILEASRKWGVAAFVYVAFVLASSVYLAWHYAIDGYVAILVTVAIHAAMRRPRLPQSFLSATSSTR